MISTCIATTDHRMIFDKALEPLTLPILERQFLEAIRGSKLAEAFLTAQHLRDENLFDSTHRLQLLAFANALRSPSIEMTTSFLIEMDFSIEEEKERLMEYFLLSGVDSNTDFDAEALCWLQRKGAVLKPSHRVAWSVMEKKFPTIFAKNMSELEREALEDILGDELPVISAQPRL